MTCKIKHYFSINRRIEVFSCPKRGISKEIIIFAYEKSSLGIMKPVVSVILRIFKIAAIVVAVFVFMVVAVVGLLNVPSIQNKFLTRATEMLKEKLQTKVEIDSIRVGFFQG